MGGKKEVFIGVDFVRIPMTGSNGVVAAVWLRYGDYQAGSKRIGTAAVANAVVVDVVLRVGEVGGKGVDSHAEALGGIEWGYDYIKALRGVSCGKSVVAGKCSGPIGSIAIAARSVKFGCAGPVEGEGAPKGVAAGSDYDFADGEVVNRGCDNDLEERAQVVEGEFAAAGCLGSHRGNDTGAASACSVGDCGVDLVFGKVDIGGGVVGGRVDGFVAVARIIDVVEHISSS